MYITNRTVRYKIAPLIEQWQRICILAERIIKRREAAAVWIPSSFRRNYFALPLFSPSPTLTRPMAPDFSSASSIFSASTIGLNFEPVGEQADLSRLTNVLKVVAEINERCWRGDDCELCDGVRHGVQEAAGHAQTHSDLLEHRVSNYSLSFHSLFAELTFRHAPSYTALSSP